MSRIHGVDRSAADETGPREGTVTDPDRGSELVCAIGHEIGNHLGAIRLQAYLLDEDLDARALAKSSIEIDGLAGRVAPLLALLRPILSEAAVDCGSSSTWSAVLGSISRQLEDEGTRGVRVDVRVSPAEGASSAPGFDWIHSLLMAILGATLADLPKHGTVVVRLERREHECVLILEDDGPGEDLSPQTPLRGRSLAIAIARWLVGRVEGRVEARRIDSLTQLEIAFPVRP